MPRRNYSVARVITHTKDTIGKYERHNEWKNEHYGNMNVDLSRAPLNVHFKDCGGQIVRFDEARIGRQLVAGADLQHVADGDASL